MSLPSPTNIRGHCTLPIAPSINTPHALPIDYTPIDMIKWAILTREMPPTSILHDDQHFHLPIKLTTSIKLEGLIFQVKTSALCQCLVSGTLDHKPITFLRDTGSSISLLDEQLYWSLSFVPLLQSIQFSVSGADDRHLVLLGITSLLIAIDDNTFQVQLVVTRNILFPVVLGIDFLQTHGGITSFPTSRLYLTKSSPKTADQSINANHIYNAYTPPMHAPKPHHLHSRITVPAKPYHVINTEPVTILARANTMMTIPCVLFRSGNSLLKLLKQHFADQPVESTPVIINAKDDNLLVHCMDHSNHEVVTHKHSYAEAMDDAQEPDQDILPTKISPEPVSQHALSTCLAYSDLLPEITPPPQNNSIETSPNPTPSYPQTQKLIYRTSCH